jgi:hypothetical protein
LNISLWIDFWFLVYELVNSNNFVKVKCYAQKKQ